MKLINGSTNIPGGERSSGVPSGKTGKESGLLSLEASITLTIFIFMMLFLYSFFVVFEARNEMAHVTLSVADSLSLDGIYNSKNIDSETVAKLLTQIFGKKANDMAYFTDNRAWYDDDSATKNDAALKASGTQTTGKSGPGSGGGSRSSSDSLFEEVIRKRYIAYLAGGDRDMAEKVLKRLHIKGGVNGLDFSGSYVVGGELHLKVKYELEYEFKVFGIGVGKFEHSVCSKLWK